MANVISKSQNIVNKAELCFDGRGSEINLIN